METRTQQTTRTAASHNVRPTLNTADIGSDSLLTPQQSEGILGIREMLRFLPACFPVPARALPRTTVRDDNRLGLVVVHAGLRAGVVRQGGICG